MKTDTQKELEQEMLVIRKAMKIEEAYYRAWPRRIDKKHKEKAMNVLSRFWDEDPTSEPTFSDLVSLAKLVERHG